VSASDKRLNLRPLFSDMLPNE
jgi:DNA sulfur modification protein DndB